jgi:hypothetical protein
MVLGIHIGPNWYILHVFFVDCSDHNVRGQLVKTRRRLELLLEDLPCDYDTEEYCETSDQVLEPLLLCYQSLVSLLE